MAETGIFCSGAHVLRKAGANANATSKGEDYYNDFISQAESYINSVVHYNWSDNFVAANDDVKMILREAASNLAAVYVIQYDMSGFTSRIEAEDMINVLYRRFRDCMGVLKEQDNQTYLKGA